MDAERVARYPEWVGEIVADTEAAASRVGDHEVWRRMRDARITPLQHRNLLVGFWPLIERFPQFLAQNLLKTSYGRHAGMNAARAWLARNVRIEQRHAEWFLDWASAVGIPRDDMLDGWRPKGTTSVAEWCWDIGATGDLAEAMAATNYAIEGVTGRWTPGVAASARYRSTIEPSQLEHGMRWLQAHADYDDAHPWEALDIIVALVGMQPPPARRRGIRQAILRSYELYAVALDAVLASPAQGSAAA